MTWTMPIPNQFTGLSPEHFARNGLPPHGGLARSIAGGLNHLLARGLTIIPGMEVLPSEVRNTANDEPLWRTRYRASANGTRLVVVCKLFPTDYATHSGDPSYWYVKIDAVPTADVNGNTNQTHFARSATGAGVFLSNMFTMTAEYTVTAGAKHTVELCTSLGCRIQGWYMYEKPRATLTVGTGTPDTVVDDSNIVVTGGIYDADMAGMVTAAEEINQKQRGVHMSFNVTNPAAPIVPTTTYTNPWDATTARSATSVGARCPTQYRNGYMNEAAAVGTIPTYCWAYGERTSAGGALYVKFLGAVDNATVTINGALGIYEATTLDIQAISGGDKVDVQVNKDAAGTTGNIYAFGMFPLIGT